MRYIYILGLLSLNMLVSSMLVHGALNNTTADAQAIGALQVEFCNIDKSDTIKALSEKELYVETSANEEQELCFLISNLADRDYTVGINFVDGIYNNKGKRSCDLETKKDRFGQFVTNYDNKVVLKSGEVREIRPLINIPGSIVGKQLGCMTLRPRDFWDVSGKKGGVAVIVRRGIPIEIMNEGYIVTESDPVIGPRRVVSKDEPKIVSSGVNNNGKIMITNIGEIKEDVYITGTLSDQFGKHSYIEENKVTIEGGNTYALELDDKFSRYSGKHTADITLSYSPTMDENTREYTHGSGEDQLVTFSSEFYSFSWWMIIGGIILFLGVYAILKEEKGREKIEVHEE